jgi:hypothetical protein
MITQIESISAVLWNWREKKNCGSRKKYCIKSGKHKKLVTLIKMCFKASYNKVCIGNMYLMHFLIGMV